MNDSTAQAVPPTQSGLRHVRVAAAIIRNEFGQIYLTERLEGKDYAHALEFPGGKVEPNETPYETMCRELEEEVGIQVLKAFPYEHFTFRTAEKFYEFYFYLVEEWVNEPFGREGQVGMWVEQQDLDSANFPPANQELIAKLKSEVMSFI